MSWEETQFGDTNGPTDWEMELQRMRYGDGASTSTSTTSNNSTVRSTVAPMELTPDPFYLDTAMTPTTSTTNSNNNNVSPSSRSTVTPATLGQHHQHHHQSLQTSTLTYSASCPSFTSLYDINGDDLLRDIPDGEPLGDGFGTSVFQMSNPYLPSGLYIPESYDAVLQFQHQHQDTTLRQYPHQQAQLTPEHIAMLQQQTARRPLHMSASFTSLSSMETEYRRRLASKRKKGIERWNKQQRHKSFDSTTSSVATAPSPATSMEFTAFQTNNTFETTPEHHYLDDITTTRRSTESDMVGFSIDEFPTTFTSDATWPTMPPPLSLDESNSVAPMSATAASGAIARSSGAVQTPSSSSSTSITNPRSHTPTSEMDLLFSDQDRVTVSSIFDAIRDFDFAPDPNMTTESATPSTSSPGLPTQPRQRQQAMQPKRPSSAQRKTRSPHLRAATGPQSLDLPAKNKPVEQPEPPMTTSLSAVPVAPIRERIQRALEQLSSDPSVPLLPEERTYLSESPLFAEAKATETAGSVWLLLHSKKCQDPTCSIAGCNIMRRVVKHCRNCEAALGKCQDACNEAKAMLLHYNSCRANILSGDKPLTCAVCLKLDEIDKAHNAYKDQSPRLNPMASMLVPPALMFAQPPPPQPPLTPSSGPVPIAPQPSPTLKPAMPNSKHVPIQPNPLPTASNPMGLMGSGFPQFGPSLALYLEQASPAFRAELKARIEKRVTTAAGQDLIQHMQKKTRLRSLEDLRSEARAIVLSEMERELHFHMQAFNWTSTTSDHSSSTDGGPSRPLADSNVPAYMLSIAAAGFAAFYAQQASLQAAMSGIAPMTPFGTPPSGPTMPPPPVTRQRSTGNGSSGAPLVPKTSTTKPTSAHSSPSISPKDALPSTDKSKEAALTV